MRRSKRQRKHAKIAFRHPRRPFRTAFAKYVKAISERYGKKLSQKLGIGDEKLRALHANALVTAVVTASVLKELRSDNVAGWATDAQTHYAEFERLTLKLYESSAARLDAAEAEYLASRMTAGKWAIDAGAVALGLVMTRGKQMLPPPMSRRAASAESSLAISKEAAAEMNPLLEMRPVYSDLRKWWLP